MIWTPRNATWIIVALFSAAATYADGITDGPYVFWRDADTAEVISLCDGEVRREVHDPVAGPIDVRLPCGAHDMIRLDPAPPVPPSSSWPAPSRLLAISDIEGHYEHLVTFLEANDVVDGEGHWTWDDGHLVFVGDIVDRGSRVTEVQWLIRRLEREAQAAGGRVHYVLGNHEAMVMDGDLRYINEKYAAVTKRLGITYDRLYGPTSEIGRWWRTRNAAVRIGDLLFVHAGYSPRLDAAGLDLETLNARVRERLGKRMQRGEDPAADPVRHRHGILWYRGYFARFADDFGPVPTDDQVQAILDRHGVRHIVVGHSLVEHAGPVDEAGRIIAIDVAWETAGAGEGLLVEDGAMWRVDAGGRQVEMRVAEQAAP